MATTPIRPLTFQCQEKSFPRAVIGLMFIMMVLPSARAPRLLDRSLNTLTVAGALKNDYAFVKLESAAASDFTVSFVDGTDNLQSAAKYDMSKSLSEMLFWLAKRLWALVLFVLVLFVIGTCAVACGAHQYDEAYKGNWVTRARDLRKRELDLWERELNLRKRELDLRERELDLRERELAVRLRELENRRADVTIKELRMGIYMPPS